MSGFLPVDSLDSPRFCGLATFMRLPEAQPGARLDAAILGLPSDSGSPFRTGARFGPQAVRAMSVMLRPINPYRGHVNVFKRLAVADAGDASAVPGYLEESLERLEASLDALTSNGVVPISLGGDHSVSLPALRAVARRHGPLSLVHFDAHSDTWRSYFGGKKYSAGTPFRRGAEEGIIDPASSIQLGMRGSLFRWREVGDIGWHRASRFALGRGRKRCSHIWRFAAVLIWRRSLAAGRFMRDRGLAGPAWVRWAETRRYQSKVWWHRSWR